jgi:hypothetical protein
MRTSVKLRAAFGIALSAAALGLAVPAPANASNLGYLYMSTSGGYRMLSPALTFTCIGMPAAPFTDADNESTQGQYLFSNYGCTGTKVLLEPGDIKSGIFRSYRHT